MIRRTQAALALSCVAAVLLEPGAGHAENPAWPPAPGANPADPATWPDDPGYAGQWNLWSWVPAATLDTLRPEEASMGTGFHADRAWELSVGRDDVLIAVLDSGALWGNTDLVNKWYLNDGELPPPDAGCVGGGTGVHDANGDGLFNVQDYTTALGHEQPLAATACDTRVSDANGNGLIDPEDLILALSDGVDDDAN
ncbi:MAG TPA: alkaline serine protease, partial [Myxococcota bacterium]|nr:alkaline serine protease [Myxococcota bacterium]